MPCMGPSFDLALRAARKFIRMHYWEWPVTYRIIYEEMFDCMRAYPLDDKKAVARMLYGYLLALETHGYLGVRRSLGEPFIKEVADIFYHIDCENF
jgi:hypothetical protein